MYEHGLDPDFNKATLKKMKQSGKFQHWMEIHIIKEYFYL